MKLTYVSFSAHLVSYHNFQLLKLKRLQTSLYCVGFCIICIILWINIHMSFHIAPCSVTELTLRLFHLWHMFLSAVSLSHTVQHWMITVAEDELIFIDCHCRSSWSLAYLFNTVVTFFICGSWATSFSCLRSYYLVCVCVCAGELYAMFSRVSSGCCVNAHLYQSHVMKSCMLVVMLSYGAEGRQNPQVPYRCYAASPLTHLCWRSAFSLCLINTIVS